VLCVQQEAHSNHAHRCGNPRCTVCFDGLLAAITIKRAKRRPRQEPKFRCPHCTKGMVTCQACNGTADIRTFTPPCPECGHDQSLFLHIAPMVRCFHCGRVHERIVPPNDRFPEYSREQLMARVAGLLTRSGVEDSQHLIRQLELWLMPSCASGRADGRRERE